METPRFYKTGEVAQLLGVSRPTLWRWLKLGKLPQPTPNPGGRQMWPADEIDAIRERGTDRLIEALRDETPRDSG